MQPVLTAVSGEAVDKDRTSSDLAVRGMDARIFKISFLRQIRIASRGWQHNVRRAFSAGENNAIRGSDLSSVVSSNSHFTITLTISDLSLVLNWSLNCLSYSHVR